MIPLLQDAEGKSWRLGMREGDRNLTIDPFRHCLSDIGRVSGPTCYVILEDTLNVGGGPNYYARELATNRIHRLFKVPEIQIFT